jgi:tryptophan 2,3-dioxygenase
MSIASKRSIKTAQTQMRILELELESATPAVSGFDSLQIREILDIGVGEKTLILKRPFNADNSDKSKCMIQALEADLIGYVKAVDHDRVTIQLTDLAGTPKDGSVSLLIIGSDARHKQG